MLVPLSTVACLITLLAPLRLRRLFCLLGHMMRRLLRRRLLPRRLLPRRLLPRRLLQCDCLTLGMLCSSLLLSSFDPQLLDFRSRS